MRDRGDHTASAPDALAAPPGGDVPGPASDLPPGRELAMMLLRLGRGRLGGR